MMHFLKLFLTVMCGVLAALAVFTAAFKLNDGFGIPAMIGFETAYLMETPCGASGNACAVEGEVSLKVMPDEPCGKDRWRPCYVVITGR